MILYLNCPKWHLILSLALWVRSKDLKCVDQCNLRQGFVCEEIWRGFGCAGKTVESQVPLCVW